MNMNIETLQRHLNFNYNINQNGHIHHMIEEGGIELGYQIRCVNHQLEIVAFRKIDATIYMPFRFNATVKEGQVMLRSLFENGKMVDLDDHDSVCRFIGKLSLIIDYVRSASLQQQAQLNASFARAV